MKINKYQNIVPNKPIKNTKSFKHENVKSTSVNNQVLDSALLKHVDKLKGKEIYREDLVQGIKNEIKQGTYKIDTDSIAKKLLNEE